MCPNPFCPDISDTGPDIVGVFEDDPLLLALARTCPGDRGSEVHPEDLDFDDGSLAGFMGWDL